MANIGPAFWPLPVGSKIRHIAWDESSNTVIECLSYDLGGVARCRHGSAPDHEFLYTESSFAPMSSWYFVDLGTGLKPERKKSGFGKWIKEHG